MLIPTNFQHVKHETSSQRFEVVSCTFVLQGDCISSNGAEGKIPFCESKLARHKKERFGPEIKDKSKEEERCSSERRLRRGITVDRICCSDHISIF